MKLAVALVAGVLSMSGCGGDGGDHKPDPSFAGRGSGGRGGEDTPTGGTGGGAATLAPRVTITSPADLASPSSGEVLTEDEVDVVCRVEAGNKTGSAPIDAGTVHFEMFDAAGDSVADAPGAATGAGSEYKAEFVLADLPSGRVSFRCSASDRASPPKTSSDTVQTFYDAGPRITVNEPAPDSPRLQGPIHFEFVVEPESLTDDDTRARVTEVSLEVDGVELELEKKPGGAYSADVDLSDESIFRVPPTESVPVTIKAKNARGVESRNDYSFFVDGVPPVIELVGPPTSSVIGGKVELSFRVTDIGAGVDRESVVVSLNSEDFRYDRATWSVTEDVYTFTFDSAQIDNTVAQITVNIRAKDLAGNGTVAMSSAIYYVDNVAPYVSLDPQPVREVRRDPMGDWCSQPFDPLGEAINDWDVASPPAPTKRAAVFRAMVWDRTNPTAGDRVSHMAGVAPTGVTLFLQSDVAAPFLVDENDDGICDDVAGKDDLPFQKLGPVAAQGSAPGGLLDFAADPAILHNECVENETAEPNPPRLCNGTSVMQRVINHSSAGESAVIFAVSPREDTEALECTGVAWDVATVIDHEGWVCAAVVAEDRTGNRAVSKPLRFCLSDGIAPAANCEAPNSVPPSCMSDCDMDSGQPSQPRLITVFD